MERENPMLLFVLVFFFCGVHFALVLVSTGICLLICVCTAATIVLPSAQGHLFEKVQVGVCREPILEYVCDRHHCFILPAAGEIKCENSYTHIELGNTATALAKIIIMYCFVARPVVDTVVRCVLVVFVLVIVVAYIDLTNFTFPETSNNTFADIPEQLIVNKNISMNFVGFVVIGIASAFLSTEMKIVDYISGKAVRLSLFILMFTLVTYLYWRHNLNIIYTYDILVVFLILMWSFITTNHLEVFTKYGRVLRREMDYMFMGFTSTFHFILFVFKQIQKLPHSGIVIWMSVLLVLWPSYVKMGRLTFYGQFVPHYLWVANYWLAQTYVTIIPGTYIVDVLWILYLTIAPYMRKFVAGSVFPAALIRSLFQAGTSRHESRSVHNRKSVRRDSVNSRSASIILSALWTAKDTIGVFLANKIEIILVGSIASGTGIYGSDVDFMIVLKNLVIEESALIYNRHLPSYLRIPWEAVNVHVGCRDDLRHILTEENFEAYVRADPIRDFDWRLFGLSSSFVLFASCSRVGRTTDGMASIFLGGPYDYVPQLRLSEFPSVAHPFITRRRYWPPNEVIASIMYTCDFHVTARPCPIDTNREYDFCLSFALAEVRIAEAMTSEQKRCLIELKRLRPRLNGDCDRLTSYHIKSLALWFFEEQKITAFKKKTINKLIVKMLLKLSRYFRSGHLPHYFVPDANLLAGIPRSELREISRRTHLLISEL